MAHSVSETDKTGLGCVLVLLLSLALLLGCWVMATPIREANIACREEHHGTPLLDGRCYKPVDIGTGKE